MEEFSFETPPLLKMWHYSYQGFFLPITYEKSKLLGLGDQNKKSYFL